MKKLVVLLLFFASTAYGEIYTWKDARGTVFYTNSLHEIPARYRARAKLLDVATGKKLPLSAAQPSQAPTPGPAPTQAPPQPAPAQAAPAPGQPSAEQGPAPAGPNVQAAPPQARSPRAMRRLRERHRVRSEEDE